MNPFKIFNTEEIEKINKSAGTILILIDYKKITKKCQKSNARESILGRFYF